MPLIVFDCKGIPAARRERIEAAVEAAGQRLAQPYEAWIAADPFTGCVRVLITGPQGFKGTVAFALGEAPKRIVSAAARRRMAAARRKRWTGRRKAKAAAATPAPKAARKKRPLIPEGRARTIAAMKTSRRRISTEGGWPEEGGAEAAGRREDERRDRRGAGGGGSGGGGCAGHQGGIAGAAGISTAGVGARSQRPCGHRSRSVVLPALCACSGVNAGIVAILHAEDVEGAFL
jgi:hypothetical protein